MQGSTTKRGLENNRVAYTTYQCPAPQSQGFCAVPEVLAYLNCAFFFCFFPSLLCFLSPFLIFKKGPRSPRRKRCCCCWEAWVRSTYVCTVLINKDTEVVPEKLKWLRRWIHQKSLRVWRFFGRKIYGRIGVRSWPTPLPFPTLSGAEIHAGQRSTTPRL